MRDTRPCVTVAQGAGLASKELWFHEEVRMAALLQLVALVVEFVTWSLLGLVAHRCAGGGACGIAAAVVGVLAAFGASGAWVLARASRRRRAGARALRIVMFGSAAVGLAALGDPWLAALYALVVVGTQVGAAAVS